MRVLNFAKDMVAFPVTWFAGAEYSEMEEKARQFVHSTAKVMFACSIVWGLYKGQRCEALRKLTIPVSLFTMRLGRFSFSLEPVSLLINLYLIKTAKSKLIVSTYCVAIGIWQCIAQIFNQWKTKASSVFFSASLHKAGLKIDPLSNLMRIALWKIPESRLGIGCFTAIFGIYQLHVYTSERWNLRDAPTDLALRGILHIVFGLCWLGAYENYNRRLERTKTEKDTYLYKTADWLAPHLAWIATGGQQR
jgi:hypothetical protein